MVPVVRSTRSILFCQLINFVPVGLVTLFADYNAKIPGINPLNTTDFIKVGQIGNSAQAKFRPIADDHVLAVRTGGTFYREFCELVIHWTRQLCF